jgi:hypothetical protein
LPRGGGTRIVTKAHSPDHLVRNVFLLMLVGITVEIVVMVILPRLGF